MKENNKRVNYLKLYFWSLTYLKKYLPYVIMAVLFRMIYEFGNVFVPKLIQIFIDNTISKNALIVNKELLFYAVITVVVMMISYMAGKCFEVVYVEKGTKEIQWSVYNKTRKMGLAYFDQTAKGEVLSLLSNNVISIYFLFQQYVPQIIMVIISNLLVVMMLLYNGSISLAGVVIISDFIVVIWNKMFEHRIEATGNDYADACMDYNKYAYDAVEAIDEIRVYDAGKWNSNRVYTAYDKTIAKGNRLFLLGNLKASVFLACKVAAYTVYVISCTISAINSQDTLGVLVADFMYLSIAFGALENLDRLIIEQNKYIFAADKLYNFMNTEEEDQTKGQSSSVVSQGMIEFRNISFAYQKDHPVITNVSFTVNQGEKVALVGMSGSGKSTILKLIVECYKNDSGEILIDNVPISEYDREDLRNEIGITFQDTYLFSMSIKSNLRFADLEATDEEIMEAARIAGVDDFVKNLPDGYDTDLKDRGDGLSDGEKQRISLARLLLRHPKVLLLDEVTANLDLINENKIISSLKQMEQAIIFATHRLNVIKSADRIIVLEKGRIVEAGGYEELINRNGYLAKLISKGMVVNDEKMYR